MSRVLTFILILCPLFVFGQNSYHTKKKKAIEAFEQANNAVAIGDLNKALTHITEAIDKDKSFDEALLLAMQINLQLGDEANASNLLSNADDEVEPSFYNRMLVDLAQYHFLQGDYHKANAYLNKVSGDTLGMSKVTINQLRVNLDFALDQVAKPKQVEFEKLESNLNGFEMQYFPSVDAFGQLVFTAREMGALSDENLMVSFDSAGYWTTPVSISENINSQRNEGTASISADGKTLVFTGCNKGGNIGGCDLYISYKEAGEWSIPELLDESVNSEAWDSQPSLSSDGKTLYFVSNRSGGLGKQDIWVSQNLAGSWQPAVNLGTTINTIGNDCSPYIYADNSTLFYSTDGQRGLGGLDLFKSTAEGNLWSQPENLGYPINNERDQIGYSISLEGWAYYSEVSEEGRIYLYRLKLPEDVLPERQVAPWSVVLVNGESGEPIESLAKLAWSSDTLEAATGKDGSINMILSGKSGAYSVSVSGFETKLAQRSDSVVRLYPYKVGQSLGEPLLFETNSTEFSERTEKQLEEALEFLLLHPEVVVEISGHTDAVGSEMDNLRLSEARAWAVYHYFLKKSVPKENLVFKGYGESKLMKGNAGLMVNSQNRRVELKIAKILN
ncbi:OmpA family protein [Roseivirga pacifica]|uniref:OmpA family protein n=1 Tax=Roseivirga pacifica TaxID=1267423 RepID=UPI002094828E|nr:OmpA family protein [Roseivirga pacifica]MCO6358658.1 OmpA family protein [Roseivirga pacifica]MCO6365706.1 OmpA family protein [Roseivirga pacifica]MCO6371564.1 OmpA family protein [Roseivirga pacifica]MCO6376325.1 OmpA family protein [Roseivirga pacifica]MCO6378942.1 OmpA family protein [Roseivirga pacifica]